MMRASAACFLLLLLAAAPLQPVSASIWDDIRSTFSDAYARAKDVFSSAKDTVQCKVVDLTSFTMEPCWEAPPSELCTDTCKAQLDKLPSACLERLASDVVKEGNRNVTARLEDQLEACGFANLTAFASGAWPRFGGLLAPAAALGLGAALAALLG